MKKRLISLLLISSLLGLILTACGGQQTTATNKSGKDSGQVYTLKFAHFWSAGHILNTSVENYIKRVEELSKGRIKIQNYPAGQLGTQKDMLNLVSQGTADIVPITTSIYTGQLPLNSVMVLPYYTTSVEGTKIYQRLLKAAPEVGKEFEKYGTKVLFELATSQYDIGTVKKPVHSPEDIKGLTISSTGGFTDKIAAKYGVNVRTVASPDIYESTQKGIVEGNILSPPSIQGYKLTELDKYYTHGLRMGGAPAVFIINEKTWQKLPKDLQKILLQAGEESSKNMSENWDKLGRDLLDQFRKQGMTITTITPEERAKWDAKVKGIDQDWIKDMNDKGLPGKKIFDEYHKIAKEVAK